VLFALQIHGNFAEQMLIVPPARNVFLRIAKNGFALVDGLVAIMSTLKIPKRFV